MRKIGAPQHTRGCGLDKCSRYRYVRRIGRHGNALRPSDLYPAVIQFGKLYQGAQRRLIDPACRRHPSHMIDNKWQWQFPHDIGHRNDVRGVHVQDHVPTASLDAVDHAIKHRHVRGAAEMLDEIKAHSPDASAVERIEVFVGEAVIDYGDAPITPGTGGDAIKHRGIVGAVAARLHDHGTIDAEVGVQCRQHFLRCIRRCVSPARSIGKFRGWPEYMAMRIAAAWRQREAWLTAMREKTRLDIHRLALTKAFQ